MLIQSRRVWLLEQWAQAQIEIDDGTIVAILPYGKKPVDIDYGRHRIFPGFIDTHCHGYMGYDTNDATPEGLRLWAMKAPEEGLTAFCPTTITQSEEVLMKALRNTVAVQKSSPQGANIAGIHFEGPYLSRQFKGAQPEPFIVKPDIEQFKRYQEAADGQIKIMTLAVEEDKDQALIRYASAQGVTVNIGHSGATCDEAFFGFANGAHGVTHTFNGMSGLNHREPGLVGSMLDLGGVFGEIICDGIHVKWPAMRILFKAKGKDHLVMVTDSVCAKGVGEGRYVFGGQTIDIKTNGGAYVVDSGSLAGSTLRFNQGLRNLIEEAHIDETSAINACTANPARVLGCERKKGKIQAHFDADLAILDDDYEVVATYVRGEPVYRR